MKVGINLWTVYGWIPPETVTPQVIRALGEMGCGAVELVVDEAANSPEALLRSRDSIRRALDEAGMPVPSVATTLFHRYNLGSQNKANRERAIEVIKEECQIARAFGASVVLIVAGSQEPRTEYDRTYETAVRSLHEAAPYAEECGVQIAVENVGKNFLSTPREFVAFVKDVGHPSVRAYVDVGNPIGTLGGYPENWIHAAKGITAMVHVKDYVREASGLSHTAYCGKGSLDWDTAIFALKDIGYDGWVMIETPPQYGEFADLPVPDGGLRVAKAALPWVKRQLAA